MALPMSSAKNYGRADNMRGSRSEHHAHEATDLESVVYMHGGESIPYFVANLEL